MLQEEQEHIWREFPTLYKDHPPLQVQSGWYGLLRYVSAQLEQHLKEITPIPDLGPPRAVEVKQKFGALRIYLSHGNSELYKLIYLAEDKSLKTCEICGCSGMIRSFKYLIKTLCWRHYLFLWLKNVWKKN